MTGEQDQVKRRDDDDLTLKDLILAYRTYRDEAIRQWWLYAAVFVVIGGFLAYRAWSAPETYQATVTFMVNEDEGTPFGVGGVLGQLGLGRRVAGRYNLDKIVELARSRKIISEVLLEPIGREYIGNALIEEYGMEEMWTKDDPGMEGFRFTHDSVRAFDERERKALLTLHAMLIGGEDSEGLIRVSYNDLSSILSLTCETTSEQLSIEIAQTQFEKLGEFYIEQAIERQLYTYELVRDKVDSIQAELTKADLALALFADASTSMWSRVDLLRRDQLQREITKLSAMQAEAVKNMEYAEFSLKNARPVIQDLDMPISPLEPITPSLPKALLLGAVAALLLVTGYLIARRAFREAMK